MDVPFDMSHKFTIDFKPIGIVRGVLKYIIVQNYAHLRFSVNCNAPSNNARASSPSSVGYCRWCEVVEIERTAELCITRYFGHAMRMHIRTSKNTECNIGVGLCVLLRAHAPFIWPAS